MAKALAPWNTIFATLTQEITLSTTLLTRPAKVKLFREISQWNQSLRAETE
jgi:hypothetical protein